MQNTNHKFEDLFTELPDKKKRIANELMKIKPQDSWNTTISSFSKKINTSPSMVTRTLKEIGFLGWKDFHIFLVNKLLKKTDTSDYLDFYKGNFSNRVEATFGWIDQFDINKIAKFIDKNKMVVFLFSNTLEKNTFEYYSLLLKNLGIKCELFDIENDSQNTLNNNSCLFYIRKPNRLNVDLFKKAQEKNLLVVALNVGDIENIKEQVNINLISDSRGAIEHKFILKLQFKHILCAVLDRIFIKYFEKYFKSE